MQLNRRHFIGGAVAAAVTSNIVKGVPVASEGPSPQNAKWIENGLINAGGNHEPYIFIVRRGGQRLDSRQMIDREQSQELIRQLHNTGVEIFHTHLYKGFGLEAEREGMEETRRAVEIAHRLGMKADTYIQWNSMMYETFFAEQPQAVNWIQRDVAGLPILLPYGYQQSFRYRPCFANQEYLDYLKRIVRLAIVDVKTDFIHFDNFDLNAEPDSCHCSVCVSKFRKHLKEKYSPNQLRERLGFETVEFVVPPQWNKGNPPENLQIIYDPVFQEWVDFRCQVMSDALRQMYEYSLSLNPEVALEINPGGITGANRAWVSGIDHARLLSFTKSLWSEENNTPGYRVDGRLVSKIRSYKLARAYSNILMTHLTDSALDLGENLVNQTLGFVGTDPISQTTKQYIDFYKKHRALYVDSVDVASVAVFRSYASLTFNNAEVQLCTILVEQALIQSNIPFDLMFDDGMRNLTKYAVVVLPNSECLADEQISLLRRYVDQGGALVVIGQTGSYDQWRRVRVNPGLGDMVDNQQPAMDYQESVKASTAKARPATKKLIGLGRVGYLPAMEFDGATPSHNPNFAITNEYWKRPKNWQELIDIVHWATDDQIPLFVDGPEFLIANCTSQLARRRICVHLVNYNQAQFPVFKSIRVSAVVPGLQTATAVTAYSPDTEKGQPLDFTIGRGSAHFVVPEVRAYTVIAVEW